MATLTIRKISDKVWKHSPSNGNTYIISKLYIKSDGDNIRVCEFNGAIRAEYNFADIVVYNIGGIAETFTSSQEIMERLEELNYVGFFSDGEVTPSDLISSDVDNALILGTDNKLFVPEVNTADFLSSDETSYTDATLPLLNTDELLVNQGGIWKKVDKSEFGGASKRTINFDYQFGLVLSTATTNWWTSTSNSGGIAFSSLAQLASLTPTNNFANLPVQYPGYIVPYACRLKSITVKCFSNSGSGDVDLAVVSGTYAGSGSTLINTTILSNQIFNIHTYLGISNFSETLQVLETGFTNYVIPKGYEIRMCLNNKNVAKNLLGCTISIEFEEEI